MKKTLYLTCACLKRAIISKRFLAAVILTAFFEILDILPVFFNRITIIDDVVYFSGDVLSFFLLFGFTLFGLISFTTAAFPYGCCYCEDTETGFLTNIINRAGYHSYTFSSFAACAMSSFLCVFLADLIISGFFRLFFPLYALDGMGNYLGLDNTYSFLLEEKYIALLFSFILLRSLRGAFWGILVLFLSAFLKNRFVLFSLPVILFYFLMNFGYAVLSLPPYLNVRGIYFEFLFGNDKEIAGLLYTLFFTVVTGLIFGMIFSRRIRRC